MISIIFLQKKEHIVDISFYKVLFKNQFYLESVWINYNLRFIDMSRLDLLEKFKIKIFYKSNLIISIK